MFSVFCWGWSIKPAGSFSGHTNLTFSSGCELVNIYLKSFDVGASAGKHKHLDWPHRSAQGGHDFWLNADKMFQQCLCVVFFLKHIPAALIRLSLFCTAHWCMIQETTLRNNSWGSDVYFSLLVLLKGEFWIERLWQLKKVANWSTSLVCNLKPQDNFNITFPPLCIFKV